MHVEATARSRRRKADRRKGGYHLFMPDVDWLRALCLSLPEATEDMPWGDDLCFKIRGKIFAGMVLADGRFPRLTLKVSPARFDELLEIQGIEPAPYVGRYKWVQLGNSNVLEAGELEALIRQSYEMVRAGGPKKAGQKSSTKTNREPGKQPRRKRARRKATKKRG